MEYLIGLLVVAALTIYYFVSNRNFDKKHQAGYTNDEYEFSSRHISVKYQSQKICLGGRCLPVDKVRLIDPTSSGFIIYFDDVDMPSHSLDFIEKETAIDIMNRLVSALRQAGAPINWL